MNTRKYLVCLLSSALLSACGFSNEEIACYAWKEAGGAYISDILVFGTDTENDLILHPDRSITLRDSLIGTVAHAGPKELVVRLPGGEEAEFRKLVRTCKP